MEFVSEDNKCSEELWMDKDDMQHKKVKQTKNNELGDIRGKDDEVTLAHDKHSKQLGRCLSMFKVIEILTRNT